MLGLATHEPHFRVLREDVFFQESKARTCRICGQKGHIADECRGEAKQKDGDFDEKDKALAQKPFIWLHVSVLREYLGAELYVPEQPFRFDLERVLDDWVFMCFFVGNDFLPHLPSLDIRENGIDTLIAIWRDNLPLMGGYLTKDGHVDLERAQFILDGLAKQEDAIFRRRRQTEERRDANAKRRKLEEQNRSNNRQSGGSNFTSSDGRRNSPDYSTPQNRNGQTKASNAASDLPLFTPGKGEIFKEAKKMTHEMAVNRGAIYKANLANKSAAAALKSQMLGQTNGNPSDSIPPPFPSTDPDQDAQTDSSKPSQTPASALGKRKAELIEEDESSTPGRNTPDTPSTPQPDSEEPPPDSVRLWEEGYADRYYEQKFGVDPKDIGFRNKVARAYVEGLAWVLLYYFQGCPSWTWYYPYHYAPFAADFVELDQLKIQFEKGTPFRPFEQLMAVLPAASNHAIPDVFWSLMTDEDSDIIDFYPEKFPIDLNGKKFAWQGVALLPFIDEKRLLKAMSEKYSMLSAEDAARNEKGTDVLIISDRHPLYEEIATNFYSKRQGPAKYKINSRISEGLAGKVEKNADYLPQSSLVFPLENGGMPSLEEDHTIRYVYIGPYTITLLLLICISVHYEMPQSSYLHKSMLIRGVKFPTPALNHADIEATKSRASNTGRSYGGAPLRGSHNNGRGRGNINYSDTRPNPFAAHINPSYAPPGAISNFQGPPPLPLQGGWRPPAPRLGGYQRPSPQHPHRGGYSNSYDPNGYAPPRPGYNFSYGHAPPAPSFNDHRDYRQSR